ncbi:MAG: PP2C family protein-serine/threonine phosphatase [Alphaproteobacteria bacterium]
MSAPLAYRSRNRTVEASADRLAFLAAFGRDLLAPSDPDATLGAALGEIAGFLAVEAGALFVLDDGDEALVCRASVGARDLRGLRLAPETGVVGRCLCRGAAEAVADPASDPDFPAAHDEARGLPARAILCAPLAAGERRLGVIELVNRRDGRPFDAADADLLCAAANTIGLAVANARLTAALVEQEGVRRELTLAAEIQRNLLPRTAPSAFPVYGLNRPARQVSGDFFDYFTRPDGRVPFALGDVSGKGMNAALLMAKTASLFRCLAKNIDDPAALLSVVNREICETVSRGMFVTMVAGVYEPATGQLRFANAGHEPPLWRRPDRSYRTFPAEAPPLGILPDISFDTRRIQLDGGEFYVFTDGLTEFGYKDGETLGVDGLIQLVEVLAELPLAERLEALLAELDRDGWEARDDLTVLTIDDAWVKRDE